jgi:MFS family permease
VAPAPPARRRASPPVTLALLAVACVSYVLQQTLVVPALPTIQRDLDTTTTWVTWVFTGFLLASAVATPLLGKLGDTALFPLAFGIVRGELPPERSAWAWDCCRRPSAWAAASAWC